MPAKDTQPPTPLGVRDPFINLTVSNRELMEFNLKRRLDFWRKPELIYPWWRRCTVKVLLVTDGNLNFGEGDFGLSTFVRILKNDAPSRVRFEITLGHIRNVSNADMLSAEPGIARRIKEFRFQTLDWWKRVVEMPVHDLDRGVVLERMPPAEHLVQHHSQAVDIGLG